MWAVPVAVFLLLAVITTPPLLPSHAAVVASWQPSEAWLYDRNGVLLDSQRVNFATRRLGWVKYRDIAPGVRNVVVLSEDRRFETHHGVDWMAIGGAGRAWLRGQRARGASTISMQVAAYLAPELATPGARSWRDKIRQVRAALALEESWSKEQILEAYFNLAGFRGEAQGIGAAALTMFQKTPDALSRSDAVLIAAILPDPGAPPEAIAKRACRIANDKCGELQSAAFAMATHAHQTKLDPGFAPHLSAKLLTDPGMRVTTTIDVVVQSMANTALRRQLVGLGPARARDGAVIVVDNESGDILAYVGGIGGGSTAAFVDGADALRQAGSTLKPFLYAQVIERGYLTAASILDDSPVQLDTASGLYVPQNYDHAFKGPVSVRTALAASLNVPAVRALVITGAEAFRDRLWDLGYRGLTEDGQYYGFSLALGSAEVTLLEQAAAYRTLARGGAWSPLRLRASDPRTKEREIMTPQSAWIVGDIMADPAARAGTFGMDSALKLPFWAAVKTGTSKAMRDNWCIGYSHRYTVAVWVGNLEGDSMKAVSGTSGAAPVWRDVMVALHARQPGKAPPRPPGIDTRNITFASGTERARREFFIGGTGQSRQIMAPAIARRPRITNPVAGSVFAFDPDIPAARQRLSVSVAGEAAGHRLTLDRRNLGAATAGAMLFPTPGQHRLALVDGNGRVIDQVRFTIR